MYFKNNRTLSCVNCYILCILRMMQHLVAYVRLCMSFFV
jgi:hypothetical protein